MALRKVIEQPSAVETTYHRIAGIKLMLESYANEDARRVGAQPVATRRIYIGNDGTADAGIAAAYQLLPGYDQDLTGAEAVLETIEEATNEIDDLETV